VVLGSLFNRVDNASLFFPVEFTPQYIGVPPVIPNEQSNKTVGGGFVDPVVRWLVSLVEMLLCAAVGSQFPAP
jgi:hypothetical protein